MPLPRYWSDDLIVPFNDKFFRIVVRLGGGGIGQTFKVVEVDPKTDENFGMYVGKVINNPVPGAAALKAYQRVRSYTADSNLSVIYETARLWRANSFVALMEWVEGDALAGLCGVLQLLAEDCGESGVEALMLRWSYELCEALGRLHSAGLVHGDVSPANIIVHRCEVTLTDYDLVTPRGTPAAGCGARSTCSPQAEQGLPLQPSDDVYALAATLFKALTNREPFKQDGANLNKNAGLVWQNGEKTELPIFSDFVTRATSARIEERFESAAAALDWLSTKLNPAPVAIPPAPILSPNEVPWLKSILQVYPGSILFGNVETRGLDSPFASDTYVETELEKALYDDIVARQVRLVILCGNAGDGKTALLQHLARKFGVPETNSAQRIWEANGPDGLKLKANLDGAAAHEGKSANTLLDEFFLLL